MGLNLNLLPNEEKDDLRLRNISFSLIIYGAILTGLLLLVILFLGGVWLYFEVQLSAVKEAVQEKKENDKIGLDKIEKKVRDFNEELINIDKIINDDIRVMNVLNELTLLIPENNVRLNYFEFDKESKKISIGGFAKNRQEVLTIKNNLENSSIFSNVVSPLSNFIVEKDITFSFKFDLSERK